jgi:hypothetical protein
MTKEIATTFIASIEMLFDNALMDHRKRQKKLSFIDVCYEIILEGKWK